MIFSFYKVSRGVRIPLQRSSKGQASSCSPKQEATFRDRNYHAQQARGIGSVSCGAVFDGPRYRTPTRRGAPNPTLVLTPNHWQPGYAARAQGPFATWCIFPAPSAHSPLVFLRPLLLYIYVSCGQMKWHNINTNPVATPHGEPDLLAISRLSRPHPSVLASRSSSPYVLFLLPTHAFCRPSHWRPNSSSTINIP